MIRVHFKSNGLHRVFDVDIKHEDFDHKEMKKWFMIEGYPVDGAILVEVNLKGNENA